jgi:hypothetical protein
MINYLKLNKLLYILAFLWVIGSLMSCAGGRLKINNLSSFTAQHSIQRNELEKVIYTCQINGGYLWKKYSLSGLLLIKKMDDESSRVVFQNEMGMTFFDFEWDSLHQFKVLSIIDKMNHEALIKTLKKDFEVLLRLYPAIQLENLKSDGSYIMLNLPKGKAVYTLLPQNYLQNVFIVDDANKKIVSFLATPFQNNSVPSSMTIQHHKANFDIHLKQLHQ